MGLFSRRSKSKKNKTSSAVVTPVNRRRSSSSSSSSSARENNHAVTPALPIVSSVMHPAVPMVGGTYQSNMFPGVAVVGSTTTTTTTEGAMVGGAYPPNGTYPSNANLFPGVIPITEGGFLQPGVYHSNGLPSTNYTTVNSTRASLPHLYQPGLTNTSFINGPTTTRSSTFMGDMVANTGYTGFSSVSNVVQGRRSTAMVSSYAPAPMVAGTLSTAGPIHSYTGNPTIISRNNVPSGHQSLAQSTIGATGQFLSNPTVQNQAQSFVNRQFSQGMAGFYGDVPPNRFGQQQL